MDRSVRYFATFEHKITNRVIERAYESTPYPNADGTIDFYKQKMGKWDSIASNRVESFEDAEYYFRVNYPTIYREDEWRIVMRSLPCECCKRTERYLSFRKGYGDICGDCHTVLDMGVDSESTLVTN